MRISGLDFAQCWSLRRTALKAQAQQEYQKAYFAWLAAIEQNPADPKALRGFLGNFVYLPHPSESERQVALGETGWLLKLSKTNEADLELVSSLFAQFHWYDAAVYFLAPCAEKLPVTARPRFLYALLARDRAVEAGKWLKQWADDSNSSNLKLYRLAFEAGWGSGVDAAAAARKLRSALSDPENSKEAAKLYLRACSENSDLDGFSEALKILDGSGEATALDSVAYWKLLVRNNRKTEATQLAQACDTPPRTDYEMLRLAESFAELGLLEKSRDLIKKYAPVFGYSPEIWASYASVLEDLKDWTGLRSAALEMREHPVNQKDLWGFSYFLEGRAELGLGRTAAAEAAFLKASESNYPLAGVGLLTAKELDKAQYPQYARKIFRQLETKFAKVPGYWEDVFKCAYQLKDAEWLLLAAKHEYDLSPGDIQNANRYAAALMVNRTHPEEAVKLTLTLLNAYPNSSTAIINHALALLLNDRAAEAEKLLSQINPARLTAEEDSAYHLALLQVHMAAKSFQLAREDAAAINRTELFQPQKVWLERLLQALPESLTRD
jgi:hypothetical protein